MHYRIILRLSYNKKNLAFRLSLNETCAHEKESTIYIELDFFLSKRTVISARVHHTISPEQGANALQLLKIFHYITTPKPKLLKLS